MQSAPLPRPVPALMAALGMISALTFTCTPVAGQVSLRHNYDLTKDFKDSLGGPALVPLGGTRTTAGYAFAPNKGLQLEKALAIPGHYSIEMLFQITTTTGWRKLIDFKALTTDQGIYNKDTQLQFYSRQTGPMGAIPANTYVHLLVTRDFTSRKFVSYINGVQQISFTDTAGEGIFSAANNRMVFFVDDFTTSQSEASAGTVKAIRIYDGPVTFHADRFELSFKQAGTQNLWLDAGVAHANRSYAIFGSFGRSPGITLGGVRIPLNIDPYTHLTIGSAAPPIFVRFRGTLDSSGKATASFNVPSGLPTLPSITLYHAYIVFDNSGKFYTASNAVSLRSK